jgi:hypothetical protein
MADFQRRNAGSLPSDSAGNIQLLHNLQLQLQAIVETMNRDRERRLFLERSLAELESEALDTRSAVPVGATGDASALVTGGTAAEQLAAARAALKTRELSQKPEHPDIMYLKRVIADLEAKAQAEGGARPADAAGAVAGQASRTASPDEANTRRRARDTRQALANLDVQLASRQAEEKRLQNQIASIQNRVAATPALVAEYTALTRDYDTIQTSYTGLLAKYEDAKAAAALERRQIGEQFKVLDRARLPESPISPDRPLIVLLGAIAGLMAGFGLVALAEQRDKGLRSEDDVMGVLRLPVLAAIPAIETRNDRRRRKRNRVISIASTVAVAVILAGAAVFAYVSGYLRLPLWIR